MSYLLHFVKSFNAEELKQFRLLDLIGKQELIRDEYANHAPANKADEAKMPARFKLSQSHFDKINSILLDKIIYRLYGDDYSKILLAILTRGLSDLMWHELKIIQRRILKQPDKKAKETFYKAAFNTLIKMFHPSYNGKLVREYGKKYLQARGADKTIEDEAYIGLYIHFGDMVSEYLAGNEKKFAAQALKVMQQWQKKLQNENSPFIIVYHNYIWGTYYKYYTNDADAFIKVNKKALSALPGTPNDVKKHLQGRLLCETGFGYIEKSDFKQALSFYEKAFALNNKQFLKTYFHAGNYFNSALCNREPLKAKTIFENYLQQYFQDSSNPAVKFDLLHMKLILALHLKQYDEAFGFLSQMRSYKRNEVTLSGKVQFRIGETIYYYVTGNYSIALVAARRNLKFLNLPENNSPQFDYHRQFVDTIIKLIKQRQGTLRLPQRLQSQIDTFQKGIYQIYNLLLQH